MQKRFYIISTLSLLLWFAQSNSAQTRSITENDIIELTASDSSVYQITPTTIKLTSETKIPNSKIKNPNSGIKYPNLGIKKSKLTLNPIEYKLESKKIKFDTIYYKPNWQSDTALHSKLDFPQPTPAEQPRYKDNAITNVKYLDMNQGLSSSYVFTSIIDKYGFLWLGTFNGGLLRYNGHSFINFTINHGLPDNSVRSLLEDSKGRIWIGTAGSGIVIYDGHSLIAMPDTLMLSQLYPFDMKEDSDGAIWVSTMKNGLFKITENAIVQMQKETWLQDQQIFTVSPQKNCTWLGSDSTFCRLHNDTLTRYVFKQDSISDGIKTFHHRSENEMFLGGKYNLLYLNENRLYTIKFRKDKEIGKVKTIVEDKAKNLWVGTTNYGVYKIQLNFGNIVESSVRNYYMDHGLSQNYVTNLSIWGNVLWITTFEGGINKFIISSFDHMTKAQGIDSDLVWAFAEDKKRDMWLGTEKSGIAHVTDSVFTHYERPPLHSHIVLSGMADHDGNVWFGTYKGGLYKIEDNNLLEYQIIPNEKKISVISIAQSKSGNMWFGTWGHGLFKYDGKKMTRYYNADGLGKNAIFRIIEDFDGNIWAATEGSGVYKISGNKIINYNTENILPNNDTYTIKQLNDSSIWIGTSGNGIVVLKNNRTFLITQDDGLSSNMVSSIEQDSYNRIWVGTENGLNLIRYNDTTKFAARTAKDLTINVYDQTDGLKGIDFYNNSVYIDRENRIWWGTGKCVTSTDLDELDMDEKQGRVVIDGIQINQQWVDFHNWEKDNKRLQQISKAWKLAHIDKPNKFLNTPKQIELPYALRHVTFHFCINGSDNPYKVKYYTRLFPLESEWSVGTNEPKAEYRNISPGEYLFEVYAIDHLGNKTATESQQISVRPPWWLTWWAYTLYITLILILIIVAHRWRTQVLKQRQRELENTVKERTIEIQEKNEELRTLIHQVSEQRNELEVQRNTVVKQRDQLKLTNQSISQSIDYAQRIQSALLTEHALFKSIFPGSFLLFKPRDIVSGDFYWWAKINNDFIVVVADCTGHGVPGAFMSMLGITFLREIILKEQVLEPAEILNKLRTEIIQILKQQQKPGEQRDGMDMSLIKYNLTSKELFFAGAHHSLLINNGVDVDEIKGDRLPIAIYPKMKPFSTQQINYKPGDRIYMFSDGFQDQFGETKNTKIKKSGFINLIKLYTHIPMQEQDALLAKFLEEWQGKTDRLDDILILGFEMPE